MHILITGANGFLGQHLVRYLINQENIIVTAISRGGSRILVFGDFTYYSLDLTDAASVYDIIYASKPDVIIHTAAMSKPDECEANQDLCIANNVTATNNLLAAYKASEAANKFFIYASTDFVFGENGPHSETDKPAPLNFYGQSKLDAEKLVETSGLQYCIMRPVFIYGPTWDGLKGTFLQWVKNNLEQQKKIKVVSDQQRTPTYVYDICKGLHKICLQQKSGYYHLAGKDVLSPYDMAVQTAKVLQLDETLIEKVTSETFPEPVQRAKRSGLKIDKAIKDLNYNPVSFEEGVRLTFGIPI